MEKKKHSAQETPPPFATAEAFTKAANTYFAQCDAEERLYGEAGLCLALSKHSAGGQIVTLGTLRSWYDGEACEYLQDAVQAAYLRIQDQAESDPRYFEKSALSSKAMLLLKQRRLGGYRDKGEQKTDATVTIVHGASMDETDFE